MCSIVHGKEVIDILQYNDPIRPQDNLTISIDSIVIDLYISNPNYREELMTYLDKLPIRYAVELVHWNSFRPGSFREQFSLRLQDGNSFWLGVVLNGRKADYGRVRLDANPNKVAQHIVFQKLLSFILERTRPMHRTIKRFDLAIDIPVLRSNVFLVKDNRAYIERRHGQEWTQYLGAKSSTVGRVKLYNKAVEAGLGCPLTRLELTIDPATPFDKLPWPVVYYLKDLQMCFDEFKSTETERFILNAILQGCGTLDQLGRKTREKIKMLLEHYVTCIEIQKKDYAAIQNQLHSYINGTFSSITTQNDQPPPPPPAPLPDWVKEIEDEEIKQTGLPF